MDDVITLIAEDIVSDDNGNQLVKTSERTVFCRRASISQTEFFKAGQKGIIPRYEFKMSRFDYNGEKLVRYNDLLYSIYRTYETDEDDIELYVEVKAGVTYGGQG